jgi:glycerol uptake facilitator-like aquaporin
MEMTRIMGDAYDRNAPDARTLGTKPSTLVEIITTAALALSTIVALTAVSIGIARADTFGSTADSATAPLTIALFIGLLLSAMGGVTAIMADGRSQRR